MKRWLAAAPAFVFVTVAVGIGFAFEFRPAVAQGVRPLFQILATISCSSASPCQTYSNTSSGAGLTGTSAKGKGLIGQTKFNSTSSANGTSGVVGQDLSTSGTFDVGVEGTSTRGMGVLGVSNSSSFPGAGVSGRLGTPSGLTLFAEGAVYGDSANSSGILGTSANADGVVGASSNKIGALGLTFNKSATTKVSESGVFGEDGSSDGGNLNIGVLGESTNGTGVTGTSSSGIGVLGKSTSGVSVQGSSSKGVGVNAVGGAGAPPFPPALSVVGAASGVDLIDACPASTINPCNPDGNDWVFRLGDTGAISAKGGVFFEGAVTTADCFVIGIGGCSSGNVNITGQYQVNGACVAGCPAATAARPGRAVTRYVGTQTLPTVEDFGEAQLISGQAYVPLAPDFENVIDGRANYLVFITPEGDNRGLYVTNKTYTGFAVHESQGGRSTLMFSYRIVAKPYGTNQARLPMITIPALRTPRRVLHP